MNAPALAALPEPTEAQLRATWAQLKRDNWPDTYEEAMEDAVLGRLVKMNARHPPPQVRHVASAALAAPIPAAPATRGAAPARHFSHFTPPPGYVDRMRAAAGDRDED